MGLVCLHDADLIKAFLTRQPLLHLYALGDLDPLFWPRTTWYGWEVAGRLEAIVLVYAAPQVPAVLAYATEEGAVVLRLLLGELRVILPQRFHLQSSLGAVGALEPWEALGGCGQYLRMGLSAAGKEAVAGVSTEGVELLGDAEVPELLRLYQAAYPRNWFDPSMLATGAYRGIRRDGELVAAGGVHAVSAETRVAALGNIAVLPEWRAKGLGRRVTAAVVAGLLGRARVIGLNVAEGNGAAVKCYEGLGFEVVARFEERMLRLG